MEHVDVDRAPIESGAVDPLRVGSHTLRVAEAAPTPRELRAAFSRYPTGVVALCAEVDGTPVGLVATSFSVGTSFDPPLATVAVQNTSTTWPVLRRADIIGVSVLAEDQAEAGLRLSSRSADRFAGLELARCERDEALLVAGAAMWLECRVHAEVPAGDHTLVVLDIRGIRVHEERMPLVYHAMGFRTLAAGADPMAADTTGTDTTGTTGTDTGTGTGTADTTATSTTATSTSATTSTSTRTATSTDEEHDR